MHHEKAMLGSNMHACERVHQSRAAAWWGRCRRGVMTLARLNMQTDTNMRLPLWGFGVENGQEQAMPIDVATRAPLCLVSRCMGLLGRTPKVNSTPLLPADTSSPGKGGTAQLLCALLKQRADASAVCVPPCKHIKKCDFGKQDITACRRMHVFRSP